MSLVLDAGALIAYERRSQQVTLLLERALRNKVGVVTTTGVVAQVWHSGARQARLALLLGGVAEVELSSAQARRVGVLLSAAGRSDVVDASVVDAARDGDEILTSDADDIVELARSCGKNLLVTPVS
ncbi:MAG: hypothetical protein ACRDPW_07540 [Mycobacteriales bacterium]